MSAVARERVDRPATALPLVCRSVSRSHVGRVRLINEDRVLDDPAAGLWAVADGMGGHSGGDLAAQQIVDTLREAASRPVTIDAACSALHEANRLIHARNRRLRLEAGATVVMAALAEEGLAIAWAGDSRAYRIGAAGAELLTHDHSVVQQLVDARVISPDMAEHHPLANVVTRALGIDPAVRLDAVYGLPLPGRFLLCSDGLSRSLRDEDLARDAPLEQLADALMDGALTRDGSDNVSLVLIEVSRRASTPMS